MLHKPSVKLRQAGETSDDEIISAARSLFDIDDQ
jgi:hypothetical protein